MSAWLINPPSSGTLAFSLRLAPSLPAADFPAFHTGYSASPPLAHSPFPGASSAILLPYCLLRHFGFLTSPHAYHTCLGWCCVFVTMLPDTIENSRTSTRSLYLRSSQLCLIKRVRDFKEVSYLNLWHSYSSFF